MDTVQKARTDTSDHPNKTTESVDVTSIFSESKPITVGTSDPNYRKPKAPPTRLAEDITNDPWVLEAVPPTGGGGGAKGAVCPGPPV